MSPIFLDTSAYSAFMSGHVLVRHRLRDASHLFVNPIVLGELRAGFRAGSRWRDNVDGLTRFLASPRVTVLPVDDDTAERYSVIYESLRRFGRPIPTNDMWIAAGTMQCGSTLVTMDTHFERVPQIIAEVFSAA